MNTLHDVESVLREALGEGVRAWWPGDTAPAWRGAAIDSRADCTGRLFFGLRGERADGNDFAAAAVEAGAAAAVVDRDDAAAALRRSGAAHVLVPDARAALRALARAWRRAIGTRVVAVTGSAGKTSTRAATEAAMKTRHRVFASPGNLNSTVGAPLALLEADADAEYVVCEVGANLPGEVATIAAVLEPDVAVVTNVGDAHVGGFGSRDAIAREKGDLVASLPDAGLAVLPRDDAYFDALAARTTARTATFGAHEAADVRVESVTVDVGGVTCRVAGVDARIAALSAYHALDVAAAVAVATAHGVDAREAVEAAARAIPLAGRGRLVIAGGVTIVDESYNASPASVRASLEGLARLDGVRRFAILGDMLELGAQAPAAAADVAKAAASAGLERAWWVGEQAQAAREAAPERFEASPDADAAADELARRLRAGDVVLVRGSRACGLERAVERLRANLAERNG